MLSRLPKSFTTTFLKFYHVIEAVLLTAITIATLFAITEEFVHIYVNEAVLLEDLLLLFIYLEVLAMVHHFITHGKIPVRYPMYIAIMAIARYITLGMKDIDALVVVWLSLAAFVLSAATMLIRIGHHYWPYNKIDPKKFDE